MNKDMVILKERRDRVKEIVRKAPKSWSGTTYPNDARFVGRKQFITNILDMIEGKRWPVQTKELGNMYPEDYVRLGSPFSTIMEVLRAKETGHDPYSVFSFGSATLPLIAAVLCSKRPAVVYEERANIIPSKDYEMLQSTYGCKFEVRTGRPGTKAKESGKYTVITVSDDPEVSRHSTCADAVVDGRGLLYVIDSEGVVLSDVKNSKGEMIHEGVHTIRKRLGAPPPTPDTIAFLLEEEPESKPDTTELKKHLKQMAGCEDAGGDVLIATVGLSALGACIMATLEEGKRSIDLLMCSTAYGGSSQQADILIKSCTSVAVEMQKHKFDIQGGRPVLKAVCEKIEAMKKEGKTKALTLVEIEYPTNPDMIDCDLAELRKVLESYRDDTKSEVVLVLDTTFSPPSRAACFFDNKLPVLVFTSLSKSVTGGFTTGGSVVANAHPVAQKILARAHLHLGAFDTSSKPCQLRILNEMHGGCEERVRKAHENAIKTAAHMERTIASCSKQAMKVNFVTEKQRAKGVTPATFSFNLPAPDRYRGNQKALQSLAQEFVDALVDDYSAGVKPCVSFGQQNTLVYATVPATSTQGVISEADKAKQAVGGVQLVRFSFPPKMDIARWERAVETVANRIYGTPKVSTYSRICTFAVCAISIGMGVYRSLSN